MKRLLLPSVFALSLLVTWQAVTVVLRVPEFLLPSPFRIVEQLRVDYKYLFDQGMVTLLEALFGLLGAIAAGFLLGTVFALSIRAVIKNCE